VSTDLWTCSETAERLRMKPAKLRAVAARREIAFYRVGRALLFSPGDVERFLERCRRPIPGEQEAETGSGTAGCGTRRGTGRQAS
jgi:excisionase family DNA binding protein